MPKLPKDYTLSTKEAQSIIIREYNREYSMTAVRLLIYRNKELKAKKILGRIMVSRSSLLKFIKKKTKSV